MDRGCGDAGFTGDIAKTQAVGFAKARQHAKYLN